MNKTYNIKANKLELGFAAIRAIAAKLEEIEAKCVDSPEDYTKLKTFTCALIKEIARKAGQKK